MKKIILYCSKHGGAKGIAEQLNKHCPEFEIKELGKDVNINEYETIVFGCGIYAGIADKNLKEFIKAQEHNLKNKKVMMYLSGLSKESGLKELEENFGTTFLSSLVYKDKLGAQINFPDLNFFEKSILKMVNKKGNFFTKEDMNKKVILFDEEAIEKFSNIMKQA